MTAQAITVSSPASTGTGSPANALPICRKWRPNGSINGPWINDELRWHEESSPKTANEEGRKAVVALAGSPFVGSNSAANR